MAMPGRTGRRGKSGAESGKDFGEFGSGGSDDDGVSARYHTMNDDAFRTCLIIADTAASCAL